MLPLRDDARLGGSLDGNGNPTKGYTMRGGRMLTTDNYECTWDLFKSIPSLNSPAKTVFDETIAFNKLHKSHSQARLIDRHAEIADARTDFLHKLTTQLVRDNQVIAVEDLAVKNMVQNRKLAQSIADASWGELVRQLEYKSEWYGRELVKIDRWFPSSKRCSNCGHVVQRLPLNIREWDCPECGDHHDRDVNAAINVLAAGQAVSVCGATVRPEESKSRQAGATKQKLRS
jgi:putative transposase